MILHVGIRCVTSAITAKFSVHSGSNSSCVGYLLRPRFTSQHIIELTERSKGAILSPPEGENDPSQVQWCPVVDTVHIVERTCSPVAQSGTRISVSSTHQMQ